ncbi:MAG: hypothetical protein GY772_22985, partial [bacterium]|nr:hypothetical protein [bacterium]
PTRTKAWDTLSAGDDPTLMHTDSFYKDPSFARATTNKNQASIVTESTYEPLDPSNEQWGKRTGYPLPAGNQGKFTYWGDTQTASPCKLSGQNQAGRLKTMVDPDENGNPSGQTYTYTCRAPRGLTT